MISCKLGFVIIPVGGWYHLEDQSWLRMCFSYKFPGLTLHFLEQRHFMEVLHKQHEPRKYLLSQSWKVFAGRLTQGLYAYDHNGGNNLHVK